MIQTAQNSPAPQINPTLKQPATTAQQTSQKTPTPPTPPNKKSKKKKRLILGGLFLLLLIVGLGTSYWLTQQSQDIRQQASENAYTCTIGLNDCPDGYKCTPGGTCVEDTSCLDIGRACENDGECCSGECTRQDGVMQCVSVSTECKEIDDQCGYDAECCSGECSLNDRGVNVCVDASSACLDIGRACENDGECCSGECTFQDGVMQCVQADPEDPEYTCTIGLNDCPDGYECTPGGTCVVLNNEICDNGIDDDGDAFIDCDDNDCINSPSCVTNEICDNGIDDDGDAFIDCDDNDCINSPSCTDGSCGWLYTCPDFARSEVSEGCPPPDRRDEATRDWIQDWELVASNVRSGTDPRLPECGAWQFDFVSHCDEQNYDGTGEFESGYIGDDCANPVNPPNPTNPPTGPQCLDITMSVNSPAVGDQVTFTCANVPEADHYIFRIKTPDQNFETLSATGRQSAPFTISQTGQYYAQCQICTGASNSTCGPWESI